MLNIPEQDYHRSAFGNSRKEREGVRGPGTERPAGKAAGRPAKRGFRGEKLSDAEGRSRGGLSAALSGAEPDTGVRSWKSRVARLREARRGGRLLWRGAPGISNALLKNCWVFKLSAV